VSSLKAIEKRVFEDLFGMASGYVLDFSNNTFAEFFRETAGIDIYAPEQADGVWWTRWTVWTLYNREGSCLT
jgi:hypothetical protein